MQLKNRDYLSAAQALVLLKIKPQTLYAYVSRGWIRSIPRDGTRTRLYMREDVEKMRMRRAARSGHGPAAATAMRWGEPVIHSSITEITSAGPRYRGHPVDELATLGYTFESVSELLWTGTLDDSIKRWHVETPPKRYYEAAEELAKRFPGLPFRQFVVFLVQSLLGSHAANPEAALGSTILAARQLLQSLAGSAFGYLGSGKPLAAEPGTPVAETIAKGLKIRPVAENVRLLNMALVVSADHELAPATFTARIAASTGANLHACVISAITAFDSALTGIGADQAEDFVRGASSLAELQRRFRLLRDEGRRASGFNHPIYPQIDPRAKPLLEMLKLMRKKPREAQAFIDFIDKAPERFDLYPGLPVGLVALALSLRLPPRSAGALFLFGRISGWVAHVLEQRSAAFLLRPRARYVPTPPPNS